MLDLRETFPVMFTYDHASGLYTAHLPNGARIQFDNGAVSGRLQNALSLFKRGVIALHSGGYKQAPRKPDFAYAYDESQVRKVGRQPKTPLIELELGALQL